MKWEVAKQDIALNPEVQKALQENEAEYEIIREIILARKDRNITQKQLAEMVGTRQSNISRLENGNYNPSLQFLNKIARALDKHLKVSLG